MQTYTSAVSVGVATLRTSIASEKWYFTVGNNADPTLNPTCGAAMDQEEKYIKFNCNLTGTKIAAITVTAGVTNDFSTKLSSLCDFVTWPTAELV